MDLSEKRRTRLAELLDLAQTYRGSTRKDLAKALGRDPTKLVPGSGVPKLDLVVDLASVLDWSVDDVVAYLWAGDTKASMGHRSNGVAARAVAEHDSFEALDAAARDAHRSGRYHDMVEIAKQSESVAVNAEQRARACNREAGGWDGIGRYTNSLKSVQRGLEQTPVSSEFRRMLQGNLANAYYTLWSLVEARAVASDLLAWYRESPPKTLRDRKTLAFAHYVAGHTRRRLLAVERDTVIEVATIARADLRASAELYRALAEECGDGSYGGIADTCDGGLLELSVELGERTPESALDEFAEHLDSVCEMDDVVGDKLESYGWWCIFGCNIALRHLTDEKDLQHRMAILTNKADQIAERLDNWSIRERVFTMEHSRWERAVGCTGFEIPRIVDEDDVRVIAGTMARFPSFHQTGWEILRSAKVIRSS